MVAEKDPTEQGDRALLNLGHTIGHAIEKAKNFELYHGECVALGTVAAAYISWKKEMLSMEEFYEIRDMFVPFYLPISVDDIDPQEIRNLPNPIKRWKPVRLNLFCLKRSVRQSLTEPLQMTRFWLRSKKSILVKRMPMNKEKKSRIIMLLIDVLIAAVLLVFDQFTKYLAVVHLKGRHPMYLLTVFRRSAVSGEQRLCFRDAESESVYSVRGDHSGSAFVFPAQASGTEEIPDRSCPAGGDHCRGNR